MITEKLIKFANNERKRFLTKDNNLFATAFSQIIRYYDFLQMILKRYKSVNKLLFANAKTSSELSKSFPSGKSRPLSKEEIRLLEEGMKLSGPLHLEIESFYLFTKILLDKVAKFLEFYFGQSQGLSLNSHHLLYRNIENYVAAKHLAPLPKKLIQLIKELQEGVNEYRDKMINHEWSPRTVRGTMFNPDEETSRMFVGKIYPKDQDRQIESKSPIQIINSIDEYLIIIINYVKINKNKAKLKISPQQS